MRKRLYIRTAPEFLLTGFCLLLSCTVLLGLSVRTAGAVTSEEKFSLLASDIVADLHKTDVNALKARDGYLKPRVAVLPLKAKEGTLSETQAALFNRQFEAALLEKAGGQFVIVSRQALPQILAEGTRSLKGDDALHRLSEMNENSRADILIIGASYKEGRSVAISYQALAVESGTLLGATRTLHMPPSSLRIAAISDRQIDSDRRSRKEEIVLEAEGLLTDLGYEPGPVDGIITEQTRRALSDYQRDSALPVNGRLTRAVVMNMRRDRR